MSYSPFFLFHFNNFYVIFSLIFMFGRAVSFSPLVVVWFEVPSPRVCTTQNSLPIPCLGGLWEIVCIYKKTSCTLFLVIIFCVYESRPTSHMKPIDYEHVYLSSKCFAYPVYFCEILNLWVCFSPFSPNLTLHLSTFSCSHYAIFYQIFSQHEGNWAW